MEGRSLKILQIGLALVFVVSSVMMGYHLIDQRSAAQSYEKAEELLVRSAETAAPSQEEIITNLPTPKADSPQVWVAAAVEDDPVLEELKATDISVLQEVNRDIIGWITIPDSPVDYPLLQGDDNHHYLKYTWDNQRSNVGAIYLDSTVDPNLTDFHTIVYGHNLLNGTMFSTIPLYCDQEYYSAHPYLYLSSGQNAYRYEIFSAYEADVVSYTYRLGFDKPEDKTNFIEMCRELSVIESEILPQPTDRIVTISTCMSTGQDTRWVVHARLEMVPEEK